MPTLGRFSTFTTHRGLRNVLDERKAGDPANRLVSLITAERFVLALLALIPDRFRLAEK
jgi:hypothetical protein